MPIVLPPYDACAFCRYLAREVECAFVAENDRAAAFMNRAQFERGAMLVIPLAHRETVLEIEDEEIASVYRLARAVARAAVDALGAVGVNVFQNNGERSGQHIPHFHVHVVPRYETSDPNRLFLAREFPHMPLEELGAVAALLKGAL
jgi:histidine triad (HIT) family protein